MLRKAYKQILIILAVLLVAGCSKMVINNNMIDDYQVSSELVERDNRVYIEGTIKNETSKAQYDIEIMYYVSFKDNSEKYYLIESIDFDVLEPGVVINFSDDVSEDFKELNRNFSDVANERIDIRRD